VAHWDGLRSMVLELPKEDLSMGVLREAGGPLWQNGNGGVAETLGGAYGSMGTPMGLCTTTLEWSSFEVSSGIVIH
jgi:hypothetical protein